MSRLPYFGVRSGPESSVQKPNMAHYNNSLNRRIKQKLRSIKKSLRMPHRFVGRSPLTLSSLGLCVLDMEKYSGVEERRV